MGLWLLKNLPCHTSGITFRNMLKHPFAMGVYSARVHTPDSYKQGCERESLVCICGCRQPVFTRASRGDSKKRWVRPHFVAKRLFTACAFKPMAGESENHMVAKQLLTEKFDQIKFDAKQCRGCMIRDTVIFSVSNGDKSFVELRSDNGQRPDVTVTVAGSLYTWALEVYETHMKSEDDIIRFTANQFNIAEFSASEICKKLEKLQPGLLCKLTNLVAPRHYGDWCCERCQSAEWRRGNWGDVDALELEIARGMDSYCGTLEREELEQNKKRKAEVAAVAAEWRRDNWGDVDALEIEIARGMDNYCTTLEREEFENRLNNRKRKAIAMTHAESELDAIAHLRKKPFIPKGFVTKCISCTRWVDRRECLSLDSDGYERYLIENQQHWATVSVCQDCRVPCHACAEPTFYRHVACFAQCPACNIKLYHFRQRDAQSSTTSNVV